MLFWQKTKSPPPAFGRRRFFVVSLSENLFLLLRALGRGFLRRGGGLFHRSGLGGGSLPVVRHGDLAGGALNGFVLLDLAQVLGGHGHKLAVLHLALASSKIFLTSSSIMPAVSSE